MFDQNSHSFCSLELITEFLYLVRLEYSKNPTKECREWCSAAAYAHYISKLNKAFPITISKCENDPPDFIIHSSEFTKRIEVTTSLSKKYGQAKAYCRSNNDNSYPINTFYMYKMQEGDWKSAIHYPNDSPRGPAIFGNSGQLQTEKLISNAIRKKISNYYNANNDFELLVVIESPSKPYVSNDERKQITVNLRKNLDWKGKFTKIQLLWSENEVHELM